MRTRATEADEDAELRTRLVDNEERFALTHEPHVLVERDVRGGHWLDIPIVERAHRSHSRRYCHLFFVAEGAVRSGQRQQVSNGTVRFHLS